MLLHDDITRAFVDGAASDEVAKTRRPGNEGFTTIVISVTTLVRGVPMMSR